MVGRLQCYGSITASLIKIIFDEFEEAISFIKNHFKTKINARVVNGQLVDEDLIQYINNIFEFYTPFNSLNTLDKQINALVENYGYIEPVQIPLHHRQDTSLDRVSCCYLPSLVYESFQYVPIIEVLNLVLSNKEVREAIHSEKPSPNGVLGSFIDGKKF